MKTWKCIVVIIFFSSLLIAEDVYGAPPKNPPKNSKTSCTMSRSKRSSSDLVGYSIGLVGGQNFSTIRSNDNSIINVITGFVGGVAAQVNWPTGFAIQPEAAPRRKTSIFPTALSKRPP